MLISNIQRFCLRDGPGIRTTVFFMGCPVRCFWCSNPENFLHEKTPYIKDGIQGVFGKEYTDDELFEIIAKDKNFYGKEGGVTFSGGECLLFLHEHIGLLKRIKDFGITIAIETSLNVDSSLLISVMNLIDYFYIDLKIFSRDASLIKYNPKIVISNLEVLIPYNFRVVFRIPLVKGFNDSNSNLCEIKKIIDRFNPKGIEVFQVHGLAKHKYESLGLVFRESLPFQKNELNKIKLFFGDKCTLINI